MKKQPTTWLIILSVMLGLQTQVANCASTTEATASVVKFQLRMAQRGHVESQYKLGLMYETAQGVEQDLQLARDWYNKAAAKQHIGAQHRLVYLDIKKNGYNTPKHNAWLLSVKQSADQSDGESALLLGQLYATGTGVPRSLTLSLNYLRIASAANIAYADSEIRRVESELDELQAQFRQPDLQASPTLPVPDSTESTKPTIPTQTTIDETLKRPQTNINKSTVSPTKLTTPVIKQNKPVTAKTAKQRPIKPLLITEASIEKSAILHPMDIICTGVNRFSHGCR